MFNSRNLKHLLSFILVLLSAQYNYGANLTRKFQKKATIIQVMDPGHPGETILISGDWPVNSNSKSMGVEVEIACVISADKNNINSTTRNYLWKRISPIQVSERSLKFVIPENWPMAIYACRIVPLDSTNSFEKSPIVFLNTPDPWWIQGDKGATNASIGGWIRLFGKGLHFNKTSQIKLESIGRITFLNAHPHDKGGYALSAVLPTTLSKGTYKISINNGYGGKDAWKEAGHLQIGSYNEQKQDIFDVTKYIEKAGGNLIRWTEATKKAIEAAKENGGGIVFFPEGQYIINEELKLPPFITIRGEGEALVNLYWPKRENALDNLISGTDNFAIENISLYTDGNHKNVIKGQNNIRVQHVRIRANAYYRKRSNEEASTFGVNRPLGVGAGINLSGNNAIITDCDIYHSSLAIVLVNTTGGIIARNQLNYGEGPMQLYGLSRVIIENNDCRGASLYASGIGIGLFYSACASYHVYFANNKISQTYGGDREAVTTDGHGTAYFGKITSVKDTVMTLAESSWWGTENSELVKKADFYLGIKRKRPDQLSVFADEEWHGLTIFIINGKGTGQCRNLLKCDGKYACIDRPWLVNPDSTSVVSIGKFQGKSLFIGNEFRDSGTSIQLYAPNYNCIVAENQSWRTQSMNCSANFYQKIPVNTTISKNAPIAIIKIEPSWYNQFLDNTFLEGNSWGNSSTVLGIYTSQPSENPQIPWPKDLVMSMGHVIRGNKMDNNTIIKIQGSVRDIIIENNTIPKLEKGIIMNLFNGEKQSDQKKISDGIVVKINHLPSTIK